MCCRIEDATLSQLLGAETTQFSVSVSETGDNKHSFISFLNARAFDPDKFGRVKAGSLFAILFHALRKSLKFAIFTLSERLKMTNTLSSCVISLLLVMFAPTMG
jgi:hypothetical protein